VIITLIWHSDTNFDIKPEEVLAKYKAQTSTNSEQMSENFRMELDQIVNHYEEVIQQHLNKIEGKTTCSFIKHPKLVVLMFHFCVVPSKKQNTPAKSAPCFWTNQ